MPFVLVIYPALTHEPMLVLVLCVGGVEPGLIGELGIVLMPFNTQWIALPPLAEQHRIVAKLEQQLAAV